MSLATLLGFGAKPSERAIGKRTLLTAVLRASANTTTGYVASDHAYVGQAEKVSFRFVYDWDDGTSIAWYYEWSHDGVDFHRQQNIATSAGATTLTDAENTKTIGADGNWEDSLYVQDLYVRVQVKRTGGSGNNKLAIGVTALGA